jgi:hypothetical protein
MEQMELQLHRSEAQLRDQLPNQLKPKEQPKAEQLMAQQQLKEQPQLVLRLQKVLSRMV